MSWFGIAIASLDDEPILNYVHERIACGTDVEMAK